MLKRELERVQDLLRLMEEVPHEIQRHHELAFESARILQKEAGRIQKFAATTLLSSEEEIQHFQQVVLDLVAKCKGLGRHGECHKHIISHLNKALNPMLDIATKLRLRLRSFADQSKKMAWQLVLRAEIVFGGAHAMLEYTSSVERENMLREHLLEQGFSWLT